VRGDYFRQFEVAEGDQPRVVRGWACTACARLDAWSGWDLASTSLCLSAVVVPWCCGVVWLLLAGGNAPLRVMAFCMGFGVVCKLMF